MYYEEKLIDGVLHYRGTPDGEWSPMTLAMYERRRRCDTARIEQLEAALREILALHPVMATRVLDVVAIARKALEPK